MLMAALCSDAIYIAARITSLQYCKCVSIWKGPLPYTVNTNIFMTAKLAIKYLIVLARQCLPLVDR